MINAEIIESGKVSAILTSTPDNLNCLCPNPRNQAFGVSTRSATFNNCFYDTQKLPQHMRFARLDTLDQCEKE